MLITPLLHYGFSLYIFIFNVSGWLSWHLLYVSAKYLPHSLALCSEAASICANREPPIIPGNFQKHPPFTFRSVIPLLGILLNAWNFKNWDILFPWILLLLTCMFCFRPMTSYCQLWMYHEIMNFEYFWAFICS